MNIAGVQRMSSTNFLPAGLPDVGAAIITSALLDTVLGSLAALFLSGANGDLPTARHAAAQILAAHNPQNPDELRLAAAVIRFSFEALQALSEAASQDLSLTRIMRLRGSAVSLSRESHKAQRQLDQLRRARHGGVAAQPSTAQPSTAQTAAQTNDAPETWAPATCAPETCAPATCLPETPAPGSAPAAEHPVAAAGLPLAAAPTEAGQHTAKPAARNPGQTWTQHYHQRQTDKRLAKRLAKNQQLHAAHPAVLHPEAPRPETSGPLR